MLYKTGFVGSEALVSYTVSIGTIFPMGWVFSKTERSPLERTISIEGVFFRIFCREPKSGIPQASIIPLDDIGCVTRYLTFIAIKYGAISPVRF